jgi:hypothetical protein
MDLEFLDSVSNKKAISKSEEGIFLNNTDKSYFSRCHLDVSFVTDGSCDRVKVLSETLNQLATRSEKLSLVITVADGKLSVCEESFLPALIRTLR